MPKPKIHLSIGHERSLCGMNPYRGNYDIRTQATFFHSDKNDQCARCLQYFAERGYSAEKARSQAKFKTVPRSDVVADRRAVASC